MKLSECGSIQDCAEEDAHGYWETHRDEHLKGFQLVQIAEQQSHDFVAEQAGYNETVSEEDRLAYRQQFVLTYNRMEVIDKDMRVNPQDYGM